MYLEIKRKVAKFPQTSGVYFMKDSKGRVLYIGKAKNLKSRVLSYFHSSELDPKLALMLPQISDVDFITADSEIDALLMEARLVKDIQPRFNANLKDDKSYPMLAITTYDDFPKVWITREIEHSKAEYYGPFTDAGGLREAMKLLQKIFKFATCNLTISVDDPRRRFFRPCILHGIRRCSAPCADKISKDNYAADITSLKRFILGDRLGLIEELKKGMKEAAKALAYERAAELRDQLHALQNISRYAFYEDFLEGDLIPLDPKECLQDLLHILELPRQPRTIEGLDVSNIGGAESVGSVVTFVDGIPFKAGYRRYRIKTVESIDDYAMVCEVIDRRIRRLLQEQHPLPELILIDGGMGHLNAVASRIGRLALPTIPTLVALAKRDEVLFQWGKEGPVQVQRSSPGLRLLMYVRDEAHRFAQHYHHILRRKRVLKGQ
jgi:excinuclease ABC subunit C